MADAVEHTNFVAQGATVPIRLKRPPSPVFVEVDTVQIQQIVVNLLRNAIEATKLSDERWVDVLLTKDDEKAYVRIEDSGNGIPEDVAQSLFQTFSTTKKTGMGLGLSISRSLAQNHRGDLRVDPGGNGRGAAFTLILPLKTEGDVLEPERDADEE